MSELTAIYNYLPISPTIATSGQPTAPQFMAIQQAGYAVVMNLALPTSTGAIANEAAIVTGLGLTYIAIPVEWEAPQLRDFEQFWAALQAHAQQQVYVHCAANMRVSAFMYLYRVLALDVDPAIAATSLHQIWQPNPTWQQFIDQTLAHYGASPGAATAADAAE